MENLAIFTVLNYPNETKFFNILDTLESRKVGYVEIGIPVTNPYVDGELIQEAHQSVMKDGLSKEKVQQALKTIKENYSFKVILMTYKEGVELFDLDHLSHELYDGIICVDQVLNPEVFNQPVYIFNEDLSDEELTGYLNSQSPFHYVMSGRGKTGSFDSVPTEYVETIKKIAVIKKDTKNFIGFGIKTKEDISSVKNNGADGAIIGTEFLKTHARDGITGIENYLDSLA
ncbi:MAG: tryptophan synthase subunit alpha [Vagococcus sp.]|uniref:tryptophan synthase subunit alpha n=1 Tax=Vagococcus sp. TaxID=1933889 RepID=UPI002FC69C01